MSGIVDSRIVQMQFDNSQFNRGIDESQARLEEFDESLQLNGAVDGLSRVDRAMGNVSFSPLINGVQKVATQFSIWEIAAITTVANIVTSIENSASRLVKSLTIDQVSSGWSKYEEKVASVQTIMNATGKTIDVVDAQLEKLMWFTDETSYSFTDMTNNIGKFTSAGVDLEVATTAMEGISTWAALSGANVGEASRAMYNLSQAMSVGVVKLQDWKSIENANMATREFKQNVIDAAVEAGTLVKQIDKKTGEATYYVADKNGKAIKKAVVSAENFNEQLSQGWFTSDVLLSALGEYGDFADKVYAYATKYDLTASEAMAEMNENSKKQAKAWELVKGAVGEGTVTLDDWQTVEKQSDLATEDFKQSLIDAGVAAGKIEKVVGDDASVTYKLSEELGGAEISVENFTETLEKGWLSSEMFGEAIDYAGEGAVSIGEKAFKAAQEAKTLTDAINSIKDAVSSKWMSIFELLFGNYTEAKVLFTAIANDMYDLFTYGMDDIIDSLSVWHNDEVYGYAVAIEKLQEAWEFLYGYVEKFADIIREAFPIDIGEIVKNLTENLVNFVDSLETGTDELSPAQKAFEKIETVLRAIIDVIKSVKKIFSLTFAVIKRNAERIAEFVKGMFPVDLMGIIDGIRNKIVELSNSFEQKGFAEFATVIGKITRFIKGLISVVSLISKIATAAWTAFKPILDAMFGGIFGVAGSASGGILDVFAGIGDWLVKINEEAANSTAIQDFFNSIANFITSIPQKFEELTGINLGEVFSGLWDALSKLPELITEFVQGIREALTSEEDMGKASGPLTTILGFFGSVVQSTGGLLKGFLQITSSVLKILGATFKVLVPIIELIAKWLEPVLDSLAEKIKNGEVTLGKLIALFSGGAVGIAMVKLANLISAPLEMIDTMQDCMQSLSKSAKGLMAAKAFESIAKSILILAGALFILALIPEDGLKRASIALINISGILTGMFAAMAGITKFLAGNDGSTLVKAGASILLLAISLALVTAVIAKLGTMDVDQLDQGLTAFVGIVTTIILAGFLASKIGPGILLLAAALALSAGGLLLFALAVDVFAGAFAKFITIFSENSEKVTSAAVTMASIIPIIMGAIGEGIVKFAEAIGNGFSAIVGAFTTIIGAINEAILTNIPSIVSTIMTTIIEVLTALDENMPTILEKIFSILESVLSAIVEYMPMIVAKISEILVAVIDGLAEYIPDILASITNLFTTILSELGAFTTTVTDAAFQLVLDILECLTTNVTEFTDASVDLILAMIEGIAKSSGKLLNRINQMILDILAGIASSSIRFTSAGFDIIISFLNGMADTLDEKMPELMDAVGNFMSALINAAFELLVGSQLRMGQEAVNLWKKFKEAIDALWSDIVGVGTYIIDGLVEGLKNGFTTVFKWAKKLGKRLIEGLEAGTDENSPSKEAKRVGDYVGEGLIIGMKNISKDVFKSGKEMGSGAISALQKAMSSASDIMSTDTVSQPVIRPVVDLSNVTNSAGAIQSLLGGGVYANSVTSAVSAARSADASASGQNGGAYGANANNITIYTQQMTEAQVEYIINRVNTRLGVLV